MTRRMPLLALRRAAPQTRVNQGVRPPPDRRDCEPFEVGYLAREPSRANQRDVKEDANHE